MAATARGSTPSRAAGPPLVVRYLRRMKLRRVYTYEVSWQRSGKHAPVTAGGPVVVRLVVGGAQVVPVERTLDLARPDDRAQFYVTPLARGFLGGERLEVVVDGRKVQEIPLPSRVVTQRVAWVLLALTLVLPCLYHTQIDLGRRWGQPPGQRLDEVISERLLPLPVPEVVERTVPGFAEGLWRARDAVAYQVDWLHYTLENNGVPPAYGVAGILLLLTGLACFLRRDKRRRRVGRPIPLPEAPGHATSTAARRVSPAVETVR